MEGSTKIEEKYKTFSQDQLVLLIKNSTKLVDNICSDMDSHFKNQVQGKMTTVVAEMCQKYHAILVKDYK